MGDNTSQLENTIMTGANTSSQMVRAIVTCEWEYKNNTIYERWSTISWRMKIIPKGIDFNI